MRDDEPLCGVTKTFTDDLDELKRFGWDVALAGVTVTCSEEPHVGDPESVVHCALIVDEDKQPSGPHFWGPGYRPTMLL